MKKIITILVVSILASVTAISGQSFTVVIDAGHGGKDGGAIRGKFKEKDINLQVALNLGKLIEDNCKDVKVIYTRKTDVFVDLKKRADIANKNKANLFISIHTNSTEAKSTSASGADTYILGLGRSEENMRVAQRENSVILLEDNYKQKYENFDPKSPESYIIFEFMTNKYMDQSLEFATNVQNSFKKTAKRVDRGVRQAGFLVLRETAAPSILIELGFINNETEGKYLTSAIGQRTMASAIYTAFQQYKRDFDKRQGLASISAPNEDEPQNTYSYNTPSNTETRQRNTETKQQAKGQTFISKPKQDPVVVEQKTETIATPKKTVIRTTETIEKESTTNYTSEERKQPEKKSVAANQTEYRVQILISPNRIASGAAAFKGLSPVDFYIDGGTYKYTYGSTTDRDEAVRLQREARKKFSDAFIIEFRNGKRIK